MSPPTSTSFHGELARRGAGSRSVSSPEIADSILGAIGGTPLVRLSRLGSGLIPQLLVKVEAINPGGSVKDRTAVGMIEAAEREGRLKPGDIVVEPSSGNTGVGLAIVAAIKGYRVIVVTKDKTSREKIDLLRAHGVQVVIAPASAPPGSTDSYHMVAARLADELGAFMPNQYANMANPEIHYLTTGPELWRQTAGQITHFVAGVGTGGTISGVGRYLKEKNPAVQVIGVDPLGSIYTGEPQPYLVEGVGEDFWPDTFDPDVVDRFVQASDRTSFLTAKRLAREEGILAGGSSGLALHGALFVAAELKDPRAQVVALLPDSGRSYLSKIFNEGWMAEQGLL